MIKKQFIVENVDSKGFYLDMNHLASISFTSELLTASHYNSKEVAQIAIDKISKIGFKMNLEIRELEITYTVKGLSL